MPQLTDPEQACEQILNAVGHDSPPTDLEAVCSLWPDLSIAEEDLDKEGYLVPLGVNGAEVLILNRVTDTTPINVFEVVSTGAGVRIRRRYLSKHQRDNRVEQVINEVLDAFRDTQVAFNDIVSDVYEIQSHLTRSSQHSRSWLVSMISRTRRDTQSQG